MKPNHEEPEMMDWIAATHGRREAGGRVVFDTPDAPRLALDTTVMTPLAHLGVLDVEGPDAERFLQGQTSAQVSLADGDFAPPTCFCTTKGRMLANAQLVRVAPEHYRLVMQAGLIAPLAEHLTKFAVFYKAELREREDLALLGLIGHEAPALAETRLDVQAPRPWHQAGHHDLQVLAHPGPRPRLLICLPANRAEEAWQRLEEHATPVDSAVWRLHDIQAGLAWLDADQRDTYLPQMINWEALGGISFKKGCYTGQEVVARAHFRGQVKKRLMRGQLDNGTVPPAGTPIMSDAGKRLGEVIGAELDAYGKVEVLAVVSQRDPQPELHIDEHRLQRLNLPYDVERVDPEQLVNA